MREANTHFVCHNFHFSFNTKTQFVSIAHTHYTLYTTVALLLLKFRFSLSSSQCVCRCVVLCMPKAQNGNYEFFVCHFIVLVWRQRKRRVNVALGVMWRATQPEREIYCYSKMFQRRGDRPAATVLVQTLFVLRCAFCTVHVSCGQCGTDITGLWQFRIQVKAKCKLKFTFLFSSRSRSLLNV